MNISISFILLILPVLLCVAFGTLFERKVLAALQARRGPNVVFWLGFFQPFADAIKLIFKEGISPFFAERILLLLAPAIFFGFLY